MKSFAFASAVSSPPFSGGSPPFLAAAACFLGPISLFYQEAHSEKKSRYSDFDIVRHKTNNNKDEANKRLVEETDRSLCGFTDLAQGTNVLSSKYYKIAFVILYCTLHHILGSSAPPFFGLEVTWEW